MTTETTTPVDQGDAESAVSTVLDLARKVLDRPNLTADTDFFDVGATSLAFVRILAEVNHVLGVSVHPADLPEPTARAIAELATTPADQSPGA